MLKFYLKTIDFYPQVSFVSFPHISASLAFQLKIRQNLHIIFWMEAPGSFPTHDNNWTLVEHSILLSRENLFSSQSTCFHTKHFTWIRYANELQTLQISSNQNLNKALLIFSLMENFARKIVKNRPGNWNFHQVSDHLWWHVEFYAVERTN